LFLADVELTKQVTIYHDCPFDPTPPPRPDAEGRPYIPPSARPRRSRATSGRPREPRVRRPSVKKGKKPTPDARGWQTQPMILVALLVKYNRPFDTVRAAALVLRRARPIDARQSTFTIRSGGSHDHAHARAQARDRASRR